MKNNYIAVIPAAGEGLRLSKNIPKQYYSLNGKPMLQYVIELFSSSKFIKHTYVIVSQNDKLINSLPLTKNITILKCGGSTRHSSVLNGLKAIRENVFKNDWILVHDSARPGLTFELINKLIYSISDDEVGGLLALPVLDTIKMSNAANKSIATVSRKYTWVAQTPQMFRYDFLLKSLENTSDMTDESSAVELQGKFPKLIKGSIRNFKVTYPDDIRTMEFYLKGEV